MDRKFAVFSSLLVLAIASLACGGITGTAVGGGAASARTVAPLNTKVILDDTTAATMLITSAGGSLTATASDGTVFTLTFPVGALQGDQQIKLTPVSAIDGLPFSGGLVGGVQMAPEGLRLLQAATLTIESPKTVAAQGFETVAFGYHQNGEGLYLAPANASGNVMTLQVWHFSGEGVAQGTPAEVNMQQQQHVPSDWEDAYTQAMQEYLGQERQAQLLGQGGDPQFRETMFKNMHEAYKNFIAPQLAIALEDCDKAPAILARALSVLRQIELLGAQEEFQSECDQILDTISKVRAKCARSYTASGQQEEMSYSGSICNLAQPFTVDVASPVYTFTIQASPSSWHAGSFVLKGTWRDVGPMDGGGSYTVEGTETAATRLNFDTSSCTHTAVKDVCGSYMMHVDLTPAATAACSQP
jgi:hypothetical protein